MRLAFLFVLLLVLFTASTISAGKCVKFADYDDIPNWSIGFMSTGISRSICKHVLQNYYSEFWVEDDTLAQLADPANCEGKAGLIVDMEIRKLTNTFSEAAPSTNCQKALVLQSCLYYYPKCDSSIDVADVHITADRADFKSCTWLCQLSREEDEDFCDSVDFAYLKQVGVDLKTAEYLPQFQCESSRFSDDKSTCLAVNTLPSTVPRLRCETYTGSICEGVYGSSTLVAVQPGWSQLEIENILVYVSGIFNSFPPNSDCIQSFLRNLCTANLPQCISSNHLVRTTVDNGDGTETVNDIRMVHETELRPPIALCEQNENSCADSEFYALLLGYNAGILVTNCTQITMHADWCLPTRNKHYAVRNYLGRYEYTNSVTPTPNPSVVIMGQIYAGDSFNNAADIPDSGSCPFPLVRSDDPTKTSVPPFFGGLCYPSCPSGIFSQSERKRIILITRIISTIVLVAVAVLASSFILFKSQRHKKIMVFYTLSYLFVPLMIFITAFISDGGYDFQCQNNTELYHFSGYAMFQGLFLIYFFLASTNWWLVSASVLFMRLILGRQYKRGTRSAKILDIAQHIFAWGSPFISIIALCVGGQIGYDGYLPISLIAPDPRISTEVAPPIDLQWIFFFLPIVLPTLIGLLFVSIIFIFLIRYDSNAIGAATAANSQAETTKTELEKFQAKMQSSHHGFFFKFKQSLKLFGFVFIMLIQIGIFLAFQLTKARYQSQWDRDLENYNRCILISSQADSCQLASRLDPHLVEVGVISLLAPGMVMFILYFLASNDFYRLWAGVFAYKMGITFFETWALEDTITGSAASDSSKGSSSSGSSDLFDGSDGGLTLRKKKHDSTWDTGNATDSTSLDTNNNSALYEEQGGFRTTRRDTYPHNSAVSQGDYNPNNNTAISPGPAARSALRAEQKKEEKRKQLFKGFKANKTPGASQTPANFSANRQVSVELQAPMSPVLGAASPMNTPDSPHLGLSQPIESLNQSPSIDDFALTAGRFTPPNDDEEVSMSIHNADF